MKKITKRDCGLGGKVVFMEKSDGAYLKLGEYDEFHNWYVGVDVDTGEERVLKPSDLIGNYVE